MKISYIKINNFRNLNDIEIHLNDKINFIVGENNLGKSNFLYLLNVLFAKKGWFSEDDFFDRSNPIEIVFKLILDECELGRFGDYFDPEQSNNDINIRALQLNSNERLDFFHLETGLPISYSAIRAINFVYYDSLRNPISELNFEK